MLRFRSVVFLLLSPCLLAAPSPTPTGPRFDYLGTEKGEALVRGRCEPKGGNVLSCLMLEVRAVPLERGKEEYELGMFLSKYRQEKRDERLKKGIFLPPESDEVSLEELRPYYVKAIVKRCTEDPDVLGALRAEACHDDPRDYYRLRGAYNEAFDAFLARAKEIQTKLCKAPDGEAYARAQIERWDVDKQTCELKYAEYVETFKRDGDRWSASGPSQGPEGFTSCFAQMRSVLECTPTQGCRLQREYQRTPPPTPQTKPTASRFGFHTGFRREASDPPSYPEDCEKLPLHATLRFETSYALNRPGNCKFLLDRERAMNCCAYGK